MTNRHSGPTRFRGAVKSQVRPSLLSSQGNGGVSADKKVIIPRSVTVAQLAELLSMSHIEIIKQLIRNGVMATINQAIPTEIAIKVARDLGFDAQDSPKSAVSAAQALADARAESQEDAGQMRARPPVVTILGHVDHGKTTLLDAIRKSNVVAGEAGGMTQHIGAYQVDQRGQRITFLDTPGHEAFTAMRARGAQATDIAVLVVAADDGVMPQTVEAINHVKAAGVPLVVAINKIDKPEANPERVKSQLGEHSLVIEEWGGEVIAVPLSAKTGKGIDDLLDNILVVAEVSELKANPHRPGEGVVIEARVDSNRGTVATLLVKNGTVKVGDTLVVGNTWGRVKAMFSDVGKPVRRAEPSTPVEVLGIEKVPVAGDKFMALANEKQAKAMVESLAEARGPKGPVLEEVFASITAGKTRELNLILKTDVQGSVEPILTSLEGLGTDKASVRVIHTGTGSINEGDVMLAVASKAIILGFNSRPEPGARRLAEGEGVDIRFYDVIYNLIDDIRKALEGILEPTIVEVAEGRAEVRAVFSTGKRGKAAGVFVAEGRLTRGSQVKVMRKGKVVADSVISGLRHFKDDVREMLAGTECGVALQDYQDFEPGDTLQAYRREKAGRAA